MAFIAPGALHPEQGAFFFGRQEAQIASAMVEQANKTARPFDHTKLGETSRVRPCEASPRF